MDLGIPLKPYRPMYMTLMTGSKIHK